MKSRSHMLHAALISGLVLAICAPPLPAVDIDDEAPMD